MPKQGGKLAKFKLALFVSLFGLVIPVFTNASVLSVSPSAGTFTVDSTFDVRVTLNTKEESVNVIDARLVFPPDKLQVVNPSVGKSVIELWTSAPGFDNARGIIKLQGGIPGGIKTSNGLVTTITFRVKSIGAAFLKFSDDSEVLLNDGLGTPSLENTYSGVYTLVLPPPAGPIVASETHPDESRFYNNPSVFFSWAHLENVSGYSYTINNDPIDTLDNISEGTLNSTIYKNLGDGVHYFHIKALRSDAWGGATHFSISIDTKPPAEFPIEVSPSARTSQKNPSISFETTDSMSGMSRYEIKILSANSDTGTESFFIESASPFTPNLELGTYTAIVRAYDNAGNWREQSKSFKIANPLFASAKEDGINFLNVIVISWTWVWVVSFTLLFVLVFLALKVWKWHRGIEKARSERELPGETRKKLDELKRYRKKYGKLVVILAVSTLSLLLSHQAKADHLNLSPPFVETVSQNISNEEIFYIGGVTNITNADVIIYIQELEGGQVSNYAVTSDNSGEWFYSHPNFLSSGEYLVWTQTRLGEEASPPSGQISVKVRETALQFGSSRLSYEALYLLIIFALLFAMVMLSAFIIFHAYHGRKKHARFTKELLEAEEAIRRGFAVLRRDIEAELDIVKKARMSKSLSAEEVEREKQLLRDMEAVEKNIGKEVWDIEKYS